MSEQKMTAEERVRRAAVNYGYPLWQAYPITSLDATGDVIVRLMEEHAAAAVEPWKARVAELERERDALREALTPSGATKAAYSGEVKNHGEHWDDYVSWSAIKEIMKLIRQRAEAALGKEAQP